MQHDFVLLDRSGSMEGMWAEAINSVNNYVSKLAQDNIDTGVTLATFDQPNGQLRFDVIRDRITPSTWKAVDPIECPPDGLTPLNDAVGRIVALANKGAPGGQQYNKVAIIIMTDGMENASRELDHVAAKKLLDDCRAKGWQVIMLGANFDNEQQAASYGNAAAATLSSVDPSQLGVATASLGEARTRYGLTGEAMAFSEKEKAKLRQKAR